MSERLERGLVLVLGGARSGKSAYAESIIVESGLERLYCATAEPHDAEMAERIRRHQERRAESWRLIEEPLALTATLEREAAPGRAVLVDCLTLWLNNLLAADLPLEPACHELASRAPRLAGLIVMVSNEVGSGIVPVNALARRFVDEAGRLHQQLASVAGRVILVTAGLPLILKNE